MTQEPYFFQVFEAALLPDSEAITFLQKGLLSMTEGDDNEAHLHALAWLAPELARHYYYSQPQWGDVDFIEHWLEAYTESAHLAAKSREELDAYALVTAFLPESSSEKEKRLKVQRLALSRCSPVEFLNFMDWQTCLCWHNYFCLNNFLFARLWLHHPEALQESIKNLSDPAFWPSHYNTTAQVLLTARGRTEDVPQLVKLVQQCSLGDYIPSNQLLVDSLLRTLIFVETHAPEQIKPLVPGLVTVIGRRSDARGVELTARVLVLLAHLGFESTSIWPLKKRVETQRYEEFVRRWLRSTGRAIPGLISNPVPALELLVILRLLLLAHRLEEALLKRKKGNTPAHVWRAWRWLQRSERIITSVSDPFWREHLLKKKASLEMQVRQSRHPVHLAAFAREVG